MTTTERELFRNTLLIQLEFASKMGLPIATLVNGAKIAGFPIDSKDAEKELDYLVDKTFAEETTRAVSPENKRWRITASGRDYLATQGLS
jgi:hypothetical protein